MEKIQNNRKLCAAVLTGFCLIGYGFLGISYLNEQLAKQAAAMAISGRPGVLLDPGHGGIDGGAQCGNIIEKNINLLLGLKSRLLCQIFGFETSMTRTGDYSIHDSDKITIRAQKNSDLHNRLAMMKEKPERITVSLHLNKFSESYVHGAQVFYAPDNSESEYLAQMVQDNFRQFLQPENQRKIKKADSSLFLLYNNQVSPIVLVECGFISNPEEAARLQDTDYQDRISMVICYTLMKFQNSKENGAERTYATQK